MANRKFSLSFILFSASSIFSIMSCQFSIPDSAGTQTKQVLGGSGGPNNQGPAPEVPGGPNNQGPAPEVPGGSGSPNTEVCRIEVDKDILRGDASALLNKPIHDLSIIASSPADVTANEGTTVTLMHADTNKDGLLNQGEMLIINATTLDLEHLFLGGNPKLELGRVYKSETTASGLPVMHIENWVQGSCGKGETIKLSGMTTIGSIKIGVAAAADSGGSAGQPDSSAACNLLIDGPTYNSKFVPDTNVPVSRLSILAGTDTGVFRKITGEIKNKTPQNLVAIDDVMNGRFDSWAPESLSPLVNGKRKIGVSISRGTDNIDFYQQLGYLECSPGGVIKLSELKPMNSTIKVCTVEVDAIPTGVTTWDDAINVDNLLFGYYFSFKLKQLSPSSQVVIGDKVDVYKNNTTLPESNKYTMNIGHVSGDCEVGGTVKLSTFRKTNP